MSQGSRERSRPLLEPREGVPAVVDSAAGLARTVSAFAAGRGPVAVDAERASGYRYTQRAYLVQLRRPDPGTILIDPIACPDLAGLDDTLADTEIVLHAANQDLPCLAELGFRPRRLFDTELAARLLGYPRVALATMVERLLGLRLEKRHSAADWSTRPLPREWLRYAALDVEVLVELRDALERELRAAGKLEWAREEFCALAVALPPEPRPDPWRRTSGIHRVRTRRGLATVKALWEARDGVARRRDLAPSRVLPDRAIVEAAIHRPRTQAELTRLPAFARRTAQRDRGAWLAAIRRGLGAGEADLPPQSVPSDGPPSNNRWGDRDPAAADRLTALRSALGDLAHRHELPPENLLQPDAVRRLAWRPPTAAAESTIADELRQYGAREWQVRLTASRLADTLKAASAPRDLRNAALAIWAAGERHS